MDVLHPPQRLHIHNRHVHPQHRPQEDRSQGETGLQPVEGPSGVDGTAGSQDHVGGEGASGGGGQQDHRYQDEALPACNHGNQVEEGGE